MKDQWNSKELCIICRDTMTDQHADNEQGMRISVCRQCLESSRENFIWVCTRCGSVYIHPKSLVLNQLTEPDLRKAYLACKDQQLIQVVDICIACDPQGVHEVVAAAAGEQECGHC